jgi:anti-sigma factor RsiW
MPDCSDIDALVTPYVDGELTPSDTRTVEHHAQHCRACRIRLAAERAVRAMLRTRASALRSEGAPEAVRARCAALAAAARASRAAPPIESSATAGRSPSRAIPASPAARWHSRRATLALAAALTIVVGGGLLYRVTQTSARVMAAELTADHVKCFMLNNVLGTRHSHDAVERSLAARFDWPVHLPDQPDAVGLELVGARPCLYGEGRIAHIMYRHHGQPVSVFMLPKKRRPEELLEVLGHEAAIWSSGDRTFVLIAREPRAEVERMARFVQAALR